MALFFLCYWYLPIFKRRNFTTVYWILDNYILHVCYIVFFYLFFQWNDYNVLMYAGWFLLFDNCLSLLCALIRSLLCALVCALLCDLSFNYVYKLNLLYIYAIGNLIF